MVKCPQHHLDLSLGHFALPSPSITPSTDFPEHQAEQEDNSDDSSDSSNTYRTLIYTFTAIGGVMVAAALVLVVAILAVQHKRRKLLASQLLTQEQKIAIMKQTGYVNPTYKFFDQHKDS